jgi:hypothetical protein
LETFFIFSLFSVVFLTFLSILSPFSLFLLSASPFHFSLFFKELSHPSPILYLTSPLSQYLIPFWFSLLFYSHTSRHQCMIFPPYFVLLTSFVYHTNSVSHPPFLFTLYFPTFLHLTFPSLFPLNVFPSQLSYTFFLTLFLAFSRHSFSCFSINCPVSPISSLRFLFSVVCIALSCF